MFPDGTGFRITGITREYEKKIHYDYDADGSFVEEIEENYLYCLEYEPIMAGGLEYLAAQVEGDDLKMNILEDERYCIVVPVDDPRTQVEVQFVNPYYMVNESHKVKIKIGTLVE